MLDPNVARLAARQIENRFNDSDGQLARQLLQIASEAALQGASRSSRVAVTMVSACGNDIRVRAAAVLDAFRRALDAVGQPLSDEDAQEFRTNIAEHIAGAARRARGVLETNSTYRSVVQTLNIPESNFINKLRGAEQAAKDHVDAEVELFLVARSASESSPAAGGASSVSIHNYGNVGAIQTGSGASASFSMIVNQDEKDVLKAALEDLRSAIEDLGAADFPPADDTIGAIDSASQELSSETPNKVTVIGLLSGIGAVVSTVASLRPAYDAVKSAAALIGVNLP